VGEAVGSAHAHIAVDGAGDLRAERHHPALATLAAPDNGQPALHVNIFDGEAEDLTGPHAGLDEQSHDGLIAAVDERFTLAGLHQRRTLVVGKALDHLGVELWRFEVTQWVGVDLVLFHQPRGVPLKGATNPPPL
jgi:hypothetical protein